MSASLPRRRPAPDFDALVPTSPRAFQVFNHVMQVKIRKHSHEGKTSEGAWFLPLCRPRVLADGNIDWRFPVFASDDPRLSLYVGAASYRYGGTMRWSDSVSEALK
jgi:hypothetical protein